MLLNTLSISMLISPSAPEEGYFHSFVPPLLLEATIKPNVSEYLKTLRSKVQSLYVVISGYRQVVFLIKQLILNTYLLYASQSSKRVIPLQLFGKSNLETALPMINYLLFSLQL